MTPVSAFIHRLIARKSSTLMPRRYHPSCSITFLFQTLHLHLTHSCNKAMSQNKMYLQKVPKRRATSCVQPFLGHLHPISSLFTAHEMHLPSAFRADFPLCNVSLAPMHRVFNVRQCCAEISIRDVPNQPLWQLSLSHLTLKFSLFF